MKRSIAMFLTLVLLLSLVGCGRASSSTGSTPSIPDTSSTNSNESETPGTITVKYSTTFPAVGYQADGVKLQTEILKEKSDGRLELEFYPSSMLGDKIASMEALRAGTIEMSTTTLSDLSSYSSMWSVFSLPYLWDSGEQCVNVLTDPEVEEYLKADLEKMGFVLVSWLDAGSRSMMNKVRAVETPADMKGLRIRCMEDPVLADAVNAMGASATPLAWSECYTAVQQGTIDGIENNAPTCLDGGFGEVAKYFSLTEHFIIPNVVFVSKVWFDGLSAEDQNAIVEAGKQFTSEYNATIWPEAERDVMSELEALGVNINEVDKEAFVEATKPVIDNFLATADENQVALYELLMQVREKY